MTAIIAIKDGKRIMIGADGRTSNDTDGWPHYAPEHFKVQRINGSPNCLIACTGEVDRNYVISRIPNLLDGKDDVTYSYVIKNVIPKIYNEMYKYNLIDDNEKNRNFSSSFIIATKSHLFKISAYGIVTEADTVVCAGSGEDMLITKYEAIKNDKKLSAEDKIVECLKFAIKHGQSIGYPIVIGDNSGEITVIKEDL